MVANKIDKDIYLEKIKAKLSNISTENASKILNTRTCCFINKNKILLMYSTKQI